MTGHKILGFHGRALRLPTWPIRGKYRSAWRQLLAQHPASALWLLPWMLSQRAQRSPLEDEVPWIPFRAVRWLERQIRPDMRIFEWGSGGSTLFFARRAASLVSVEHHPEWHARVREKLSSMAGGTCDYRLVVARTLVDGKTTPFSSGQPGATDLDFENYVKVIDEYPDGHFDMVMIDGRARLACLGAAWAKVRVGGHVLLDNSDYGRYQLGLSSPVGFERSDIAGVSPYRGEVWTQTTIWHRLR